MLLRGFEGWHLVIIAGLLVVLFGARKPPDSARSIGQSLRILKSEVKAAQTDDEQQPRASEQSGGPATGTSTTTTVLPPAAGAEAKAEAEAERNGHTGTPRSHEKV